MAEPGKETAATPPPPPQETPPATVEAPSLGTGTTVSASQDTETAAGGAAALDSVQQPKAESPHHPPPPPQQVAAVGAPEQTTTEADGQPPAATMQPKVAASPPPAETPAQESAAPAAPTPPPPPPPPPQNEEGGVPEGASSVHEEKKDAPKARAEEEGEEKKPARRRWRCLRACVCLLFLRPKSREAKPATTPPGDKQPVEEKNATPGEMPPSQEDSGGTATARVPSRPEAGKKGEGETKPAAAMDGERPEPGLEQVATTLPPPAEAPSQEKTAAAAAAAAVAGAEKQVAAPAPEQPPRKQEGGGPPEPTPLVQEEEKKDAAPAPAPAAEMAREGEEEEKKARRRWRWLQAAVRLLFHRPKEAKPPSTAGETADGSAGKAAAEKGEDEVKPPSASTQDGKKPAASGQGEPPKPSPKKKPSRKFSDGAARKVMEKDDGEASKGRRDETGTKAGKTTAPRLEGEQEHPSLKRFRKVGRLVQLAMSLYNKVTKQRSQQQPQEKKQPETAASGGPGGEEDGETTKPEKQQPEKKKEEAGEKTQTQEHRQQPHPNWAREEVRLEGILEEAFARLVAAEYTKELRGVRQRCLLTFSVFDLAAEVKKQAMIYWWVAQFNLQHRRSDSLAAPQGKAGSRVDEDDAEGIFVMLSDHGFLVPMKNWCSKVIHGCQVNPLVHWMLKRQARGDRFAELDDRGSPAKLQLESKILCLTAGNRPVLQKMRMKDEPQAQQAKKKDEPPPPPQSQKSKKVTKERSLQGKGNDVQDQQQSTTTTKDGEQVGSKSTTKDGEQDPTQAKDQLVKDQQQQTTKDEDVVGSKSMADKASSQKDEDQTQAKDQLTKEPQNIKLSSELEHVDEIPSKLFEEKRVILNINAHVYPISKSAFLHLAECLVVLQLGRWNNLDDKTYMEVAGLDSQNAIGLLKNLRYLGLRGLSRLTELPKGIESLKKLVILDMRGCQNLVKVEASDNVFSRMACDNAITQKIYQKRSVITQLKQLTHLDLTECYMLEHIGRGITSLSELQVFKGFVFATGTQGNKACQIQDLKKLKKLQKLTVSITTDANVAEGEMSNLKDITSLRKLTITWSEIPSILEGDKVKEKRNKLIGRWTSFQLPKDLMKLDIRCYPKEELNLKQHEKLEKLYLRGGGMKRFSTEKSKSIKTLRLRYLKYFTMEWNDIRSELQNIEYVEIVFPNKDATREKDERLDKSDVMKAIEDEEVDIKKMKIPEFTLDQHGVWTKDQKEEYNQKLHAPNKDASNM